MDLLVIADHDNSSLGAATLNTLAAAKAIGGNIHLLVAGTGCQTVADAAAQIPVVRKVLLADAPAYENQLAENISLLVAELGKSYGLLCNRLYRSFPAKERVKH